MQYISIAAQSSIQSFFELDLLQIPAFIGSKIQHNECIIGLSFPGIADSIFRRKYPWQFSEQITILPRHKKINTGISWQIVVEQVNYSDFIPEAKILNSHYTLLQNYISKSHHQKHLFMEKTTKGHGLIVCIVEINKQGSYVYADEHLRRKAENVISQ